MKNNKGFTLLELSIVLLVVGFLTTTSITMTRGYINYQKHKETKNNIDEIVFSINNYVLKNKKLPCPANMKKNYKNSDAVESCSESREVDGILVGTIPAKDLGLNNKAVADAWQNKLIYMVVKDYTDENYFMRKSESSSLISNKFAYLIISASSNGNAAYPYNSTTARKTDTNGDDYKNSYDGFNNDIVYEGVDDIIRTNTKSNIFQNLELFDIDCYINYSDLTSEINDKCGGDDYFNAFAERYLSYGEKYISPNEDYIEKVVNINEAGDTKVIYTHVKECIIECSKYGRPVVYLKITDL